MPKPKSTYQADSREPQNGEGATQLDPLIDALLDHLPPPGEPFPPEDRKLWMQILELILKLIHPDEQQGDAQPPPEQAQQR